MHACKAVVSVSVVWLAGMWIDTSGSNNNSICEHAHAEGQRLSKGEEIKQKVRSLGFEPRLSRPQREVLTTIRRPSESDGNWTHNLRDWNPTRYHCATPSIFNLKTKLCIAVPQPLHFLDREYYKASCEGCNNSIKAPWVSWPRGNTHMRMNAVSVTK